jgi:hypothetical protein
VFCCVLSYFFDNLLNYILFCCILLSGKRGTLYGRPAMKKTLPFRLSLLLLLAVGVFGLAACKGEPDLPDDPHVPLVNPFTGVWNGGGEYWEFRPDGTGGRAALASGPFPDDFGFFVYAGQDVQTAPMEGSLVVVDGSGGADSVNVTRYEFQITGNQAVLSPAAGPSLTLERISGGPEVLSLTNRLIGEWSAEWSSAHGLTWSLKYRVDGTVKTYHHEVGHQFENAYALRGNTLVLFGAWRFGIAPVRAELSPLEDGKWQVTETQAEPAPATWIYTKVVAAEWL